MGLDVISFQQGSTFVTIDQVGTPFQSLADTGFGVFVVRLQSVVIIVAVLVSKVSITVRAKDPASI